MIWNSVLFTLKLNTIFRSELQTRYITFHSRWYFLNCSQKDVEFSRRNFRLDPNSQLHHFKDLRFSRYSRLSTAISTSPPRKWIRMNLHFSILSVEIFTLFLMVLIQTFWWTYPWSWSLTLHLHLHHAYIQPHLWTNKAILGAGYPLYTYYLICSFYENVLSTWIYVDKKLYSAHHRSFRMKWKVQTFQTNDRIGPRLMLQWKNKWEKSHFAEFWKIKKKWVKKIYSRFLVS